MSDTLPYTSERHFALRDAHNIAAGDAYFEVRPHLTAFGPHRLTFDAGYVRGFDRATELADERALAARQQAQVPEGFVLVPVEPTPEMKTAGLNVEVYQDSPPEPESLTWAEVRAIYRAMLSAAPRPGAVAGWQPISTAPKDGALFFCWVSAVQYGENDEGQQYQIDVSQVDFCQWHSFDEAPEGGWFEPCCGQISEHQQITHWMPLPAAPGATTGEQHAG